ncbi:MAG: serine hydrolase domain-containing protein [Gemmatimonadota bacterium]
MRHTRCLPVLVFLAGCASATGPSLPSLPPARSLAEFESHLEELRGALSIPGYSAALVKGTTIVWAKGFGLADVERGVAATPETEYHLASLTKTFASTVILQLVDAGKVSLDDPVSNYNIVIASSGVVRVRHLMSHTSEGVPGSRYSYNGARFGLLDSVIARASGQPFAERVSERILRPLQLQRTAPNPLDGRGFSAMGLDRDLFLSRLAKPYALEGGTNALSAYPSYFGTAAGLVSTVLDVAAYSIAMDTNAFLLPATKALAYAPTISTSGETLPYGLGWFSTIVSGERIIWHYGYWTGNSSLIIKVPSRNIAFIILANSDMLSRPTRLGDGDLKSSSIAREFIAAFVDGSVPLPAAR